MCYSAKRKQLNRVSVQILKLIKTLFSVSFVVFFVLFCFVFACLFLFNYLVFWQLLSIFIPKLYKKRLDN